MKKSDLIAEAKAIVASALQVTVSELPDDARIYSHPKWDSLGQLQIMLQLESRTGLEVTDARTFARLSSVLSIASILAARSAESISIQDSSGQKQPTPGSYYAPDECIGTLLLIHGISADRHEWGFFDLLSLMAADQGFAVLAIDYQGHGASRIPAEQLSLLDIVREIENAQVWLRERHAGFSIVLGNSFGAGVSLIAGTRLGVDLVGMSCAVTSYEADLSRVNGVPVSELSVESAVPYSKLRLPSSVLREMADVDSQLKATRPPFPVVFFHGGADSDVPCEEARRFAERLPAFEFFEFENMDHTFTAPVKQKQRDEATVVNREVAATKIAEVLGARARART